MARVLAFVVVLSFMSVACSVADIPGSASVSEAGAEVAATSPDARGSSGDEGAACGGGAIGGAFGIQDPSKLEACACAAGGRARCVTTELPEKLSRELAACEGGRCVPDSVFERGAIVACRSSKKVLGKQLGEGRCVSLCVPKVAENASLLDRGDGDTCAADERCVPCKDPRDGTPSGICDVEVSDIAPSCTDGPGGGAAADEAEPRPKEDPPGAAGCCGGAGRCVSAIDASPEAHMTFGSSGCGFDQLCMPVETPAPKCTARSLLGDSYRGVCLKDCLVPLLSVNLVEVAQGSCGADETCVPCTRHGIKTPAPGC